MNVLDYLHAYSDPFVIYGAQVVAYGACTAITELYNRKPECFVVNNPKHNPSEIDGIPVRTLPFIPKERFIIVCVTELLQDEIVSILKEEGFYRIVILTQHDEHMLMSRYFEKIGKFPVRENVKGKFKVDLAVFEVKNHKDKQLLNPPILQPFEYSIQAGAAPVSYTHLLY